MQSHQILITMEGGVIQGIEGIPEGVEIVIKDFDISEFPDETDEIFTDPQGDEYYLNFWYSELKERSLQQNKIYDECRQESIELYRQNFESE